MSTTIPMNGEALRELVNSAIDRKLITVRQGDGAVVRVPVSQSPSDSEKLNQLSRAAAFIGTRGLIHVSLEDFNYLIEDRKSVV